MTNTKTTNPESQLAWGLVVLAAVIALIVGLQYAPIDRATGQVVLEKSSISLAEAPQTVLAVQAAEFLPSNLAKANSPAVSAPVVALPAVRIDLPASAPALDIDALIGQFPRKGEDAPGYAHWELNYDRKSIELYANKYFISSEVFGLAVDVGDIDRNMKKADVVKNGFINGFVYPGSQVIAWLNKEYDHLDYDEKNIPDDLIKLGVIQKTADGFAWNPKFDGWPINAYSNAGVFRHERVHVLWLQHPGLAQYFMDQWKKDTQGMDKEQKLQFILAPFEAVPYNRPPGYIWWNTVYDQVGEENLVNEFVAHSIEKLPQWKARTLPIAM